MATRSRRIGVVALMLAIAPAAGCHRKEFVRNRTEVMDPPLAGAIPLEPADPGAIEPRRATFVDRHPILRTPVEYYQSSGPSPLRKAAAATFIGVPLGVFGEARQVIVGCPPGF